MKNIYVYLTHIKHLTPVNIWNAKTRLVVGATIVLEFSRQNYDGKYHPLLEHWDCCNWDLWADCACTGHSTACVEPVLQAVDRSLSQHAHGMVWHARSYWIPCASTIKLTKCTLQMCLAFLYIWPSLKNTWKVALKKMLQTCCRWQTCMHFLWNKDLFRTSETSGINKSQYNLKEIKYFLFQ